jgi:hypothetical protein
MRSATRRRALQTTDDLEDLRRLIAPVVDRHIAKWASTIGLDRASPTFRQDVIDALLWCVVTHVDAPNRKRYSDIRKELLCVSKEAASAEKSLRRLHEALDDLIPRYRELLEERLGVPGRIALRHFSEQTPWLYALSSEAGRYGEMCKSLDKGGAPKTFAFVSLVTALATAFQRAKNRPAKATWSAHRARWEGQFVNLVEGVLPVARMFRTADRPMQYPDSASARGKYIYEMTRRGAASKRPARSRTS